MNQSQFFELSILSFFVVFSISVQSSGLGVSVSEFAPGSVIVKFDNASSAKEFFDTFLVKGMRTPAVIGRHAVRSTNYLGKPIVARSPSSGGSSRSPSSPTVAQDPLANAYELKLGLGADVLAAVNAYSKKKGVVYAEPDYLYEATVQPNDPQFGSQWAFASNPLITREGWDIETGDPSVIIAILDTGIDYNHPDLAQNIYNNPAEVQGNGVDDDSNNYTDDYFGWNFAYGNSNTLDDNGHGTAVAGIAAAVSNNGVGVAGTCWRCKLMPVKVLNSAGSGYSSRIAQGVIYSVDKGARVISMSLSSHYSSFTLQSAIDYAVQRGRFVVAAAGNENSQIREYPGAYYYVAAVGATTQSGQRAFFSNYGDWVDLAAPGEIVLSTSRGGTYGYYDGTSVSVPFVSGLGGLIFSKNPSFSGGDVRVIIEESATPIVTDKPLGRGLINVYAALQRPRPEALPPYLLSYSPVENTISLPYNELTFNYSPTGEDTYVLRVNDVLFSGLAQDHNYDWVTYNWLWNDGPVPPFPPWVSIGKAYWLYKARLADLGTTNYVGLYASDGTLVSARIWRLTIEPSRYVSVFVKFSDGSLLEGITVNLIDAGGNVVDSQLTKKYYGSGDAVAFVRTNDINQHTVSLSYYGRLFNVTVNPRSTENVTITVPTYPIPVVVRSVGYRPISQKRHQFYVELPPQFGPSDIDFSTVRVKQLPFPPMVDDPANQGLPLDTKFNQRYFGRHAPTFFDINKNGVLDIGMQINISDYNFEACKNNIILVTMRDKYGFEFSGTGVLQLGTLTGPKNNRTCVPR
ncbi:S8 family serine peptidase [archaeon]|nr:S8 family serine peptidase [archaeon]